MKIKSVCFIHKECETFYAIYINDVLYIEGLYEVLDEFEKFKKGLNLGLVDFEVEQMEIRDPKIVGKVCDLLLTAPKNFNEI